MRGLNEYLEAEILEKLEPRTPAISTSTPASGTTLRVSQNLSGQTALAQANTGPGMTLYPDLGSQAYPPTSPIPPLVGPPNMGNVQYQPGWTQPAGYLSIWS